MNTKKIVKGFIAGMALPAVILPIIDTLLQLKMPNITKSSVQFLPIYLPIAWGLANVIFLSMHKGSGSKTLNHGLVITGLCLGFLVAVYGVFILNVPTQVFGKGTNIEYAPLILVPIIYAILFRYVVKWLNKLVGV